VKERICLFLLSLFKDNTSVYGFPLSNSIFRWSGVLTGLLWNFRGVLSLGSPWQKHEKYCLTCGFFPDISHGILWLGASINQGRVVGTIKISAKFPHRAQVGCTKYIGLSLILAACHAMASHGHPKSSPTNECDFPPGLLGGLHPREALPRLRWRFV
jgi:hypothetical protein